MGNGEAEFEILAPCGFGVSSAEEEGRSREAIGLGWDGEDREGDATHCCPEHSAMDGQGRGNPQAIGQGGRGSWMELNLFGGFARKVPGTLFELHCKC